MKKRVLTITNLILACLCLMSTLNAQALLQTFDTNAIPAGWSVNTNSGSVSDQWTPGQLGAAGYTAGNANEHTGNAGYYLWTDFSDISPGDTSDLISPKVDVSTLTTPTVYFWLYSHYVGLNTPNPYNSFFVSAWNGTSWDVVGTLQGDNGGWTKYYFDISGNTFGLVDSVQLKFSCTSVSPGTYDYSNDLLLDDIKIDELFSCPWTSNLSAGNLTGYSADLFWTENGSATSWELGVVEAGMPLSSGISTVENNDSTSATGLMPTTDYEAYVRAICGVGDTSDWEGPINFTTLCAPYSPTHTEDFSTWTSTATLPDCWSEYNSVDPTTIGTAVTENSSWINDGFGNDAISPHSVSSTVGSASIELYNLGDSDWLVSPEIDLGAAGGPFQLDFNWTITYWSSTAAETISDDDYIALMITTDAGATWTELDRWDSSTVITPTPNGIDAFYDLSAYTGIVQFGFWGNEGTVNDVSDVKFFMDNFRVRPIPACPSPYNLVASAISSNSITLEWSNFSTPSSWQIEYGVSGFTQGTGTLVDVNSMSGSISSLAGNTTYDFYVRSICGTDTSDYSSPISVTTLCAPISTPFFEDFESIATDLIGDFTNCWEGSGTTTSVYRWQSEDASGTDENSTDTGPFYDHTLSGTPGGIYLFTEASSGAQGNTTYLTSPLIDLTNLTTPRISFWYHMYGAAMGTLIVQVNNDLLTWNNLFTISGEQQAMGSDEWLKAEINLSAYAGDTVQVRFAAVRGSSYTGDISIDDVSVEETPTNDISVLDILTPVDRDCGSTNSPLTLSVVNYGSETQYNVPFVVDVNGAFNGSFTTTIDSIISNDTMTVVIDSMDNSFGGMFDFTAYHSHVGDQVLSNDTLSESLVIESTPNPLVINDVNICSGDTAVFNNTSGLTAYWFFAGDYSIRSDSSTFIVNPSVTTSYEVLVFGESSESIGETNPPTSGYNPGSNSFYGLFFETQQDFVLDSLTVYPEGSGSITIGLYDEAGDTIVEQITVNVSDGGTPLTPVTVALNLFVPASASQYRLLYLSNFGITRLGRLLSGANFPYVSANGLTSITNSSTSETGSGSTSSYYFFYDWHISYQGCPSERTLFTVHVNENYNDTLVVTTCDEFTYNGTTVTTTGFYTDSLSSVNGCDSVITYNVTINNSTMQTQTPSICDGDTIVVGGNEYFTTGLYTDTLTNALGCDSILTTDLTVNTPSAVTITGLTPEICDNAGIITVSTDPLGGTLSGSGVNGNNFDPASAGQGFHTITYSLTDGNGCTSSISVDIEVIECTGIQEITGIEKMIVYPNPFVNSINLQFNDKKSGELRIKLYDVNGRMILSKDVVSVYGVNNIELLIPENTANGVHLIQLERDGASYSRSLLKN